MNSKQQIFALIAVITMVVSGAANAQPFNRYFSAQGALASVDNGYDNGISGVFTYGVRVPEMHKNFAVETEFTTSVLKPENNGSELTYYTLAAYGVYAHPLNNKFHFRGRLGILYEDVEAGGASDDDVGLSFGIGITANMSKTTRFILEYTVIESDITHLSAGLQFKL